MSRARVHPPRSALLWLALVVALPLASFSPAAATQTTGRTALGLETGLWKLRGGDRDYSNLDQRVGLELRRGLTDAWSLEFNLAYGWVRPGVDTRGEDAGWTTGSGSGLYTTMLQPRVGILRHLANRADVNPFLGLSAGLLRWQVRNQRGADDFGLLPDGPVLVGLDEEGRTQELKGTNATFTLTAGADWFLSELMGLAAGVRWHLLAGNDVDNVGFSAAWGEDHVDANGSLLEGFLGVTFLFGATDSDRDGITDRRDACPDSPEDYDGFEDDDGCEDSDNDADGIGDGQDICPDDPEDVDGYEDADGCPEADNDGDGVPDPKDRCPTEAEDLDGHRDTDGCPDADDDGDGVPDAQDRCPETPEGARVAADGCPEAEPVLAADLVLKDVQFEPNSAQLLPQSDAPLRELAETLMANPEIRIEVRGHTDDVGPSEVNRDLSQRRAMAVRQALIAMGVEAHRIVAVGYGEDYPVDGNGTPEGRARNRRVEIHRID